MATKEIAGDLPEGTIIESNYEQVVESFDDMKLKSELLRGT